MELFFIVGILVICALFFRQKRAALRALIAILMILGVTQNLSAASQRVRGLGLLPDSEEAWQEARETWPEIVAVRPNKVGRERIKEHQDENGLSVRSFAPEEEEFVTVKGGQKLRAMTFDELVGDTELPSSVDNSLLPSFPPIGNQGRLGSCVAWATTYYQCSHEYGLLNGINNKTSQAHVFSPKWTYNLLNNGVNGGLYIFPTYNLLAQNGLVYYSQFLYDNNYTQWDLNPDHWKTAISNRMMQGYLVPNLGGDEQNLQMIKQLLNNGHILTFGTGAVYCWQKTKVGIDPTAPSNPHAGEQAVSWQNCPNGSGHCITIVGYDDNVWVDINGNGVVDAGEKGAFKIANSWGTGYGNQGFIWIAYDAFRTTSAVVNGPSTNRYGVAAFSSNSCFAVVPLAHNYSPKLVAEFTLTQSVRSEIYVVAGVSNPTTTTATKTFLDYALRNQGGNCKFDGTSPGAPQTATFYVDLTDLLSEQDSLQRYYLTVRDKKSGNPTTVESFTLVDLVSDKRISCTNTPISCDASQATLYVDYDFQSHSVPPLLPMIITSPTANQKITKTFWVTTRAQNDTPISKVEFYVDGVLKSTDTTAPYTVQINARALSRGNHTITVINYDELGNSELSSVVVKKGK